MASTTATRLDSPTLIDLEERFGAHNYHPLDVVLTRAEGIWVWDTAGNRYLDFLACYSAVNQGHCHPRLLAVFREQAERLTLTSRAFRNDQLPLLCKEICELTGFEKFLPMNSGAEGVETAIKAARKWGYTRKGIPDGQAEIITFENNFHGRTTTIVGFSSDAEYRRGFGPFSPGFPVVPYGDARAVEEAIGSNTAAVLVEPIQGEGGIIVPPEGYLSALRELCDRHRILLICDEIQSGLGRTGAMFAWEHEKARPDMMIVGKALSGGFYPVSGILADDAVMSVFEPGQHGSTYGGNPLACAVAREALRVLVDEGMVENSARMGEYLMEQLRAIESPHIKEIRGKGLWIGVELTPEANGARRYCETLQEKGLLCKETHVNVLRFAPPLTIGREDIDWALERVRETFAELG
jgi:ornithine--oxo-acid transaminase